MRIDCVSVTAATEALLERMYAHLLYNEVSKAETYFYNALTITGLEIEIIGVSGKRTRFQEKCIPQLIARVSAISFEVLDVIISTGTKFSFDF